MAAAYEEKPPLGPPQAGDNASDTRHAGYAHNSGAAASYDSNNVMTPPSHSALEQPPGTQPYPQTHSSLLQNRSKDYSTFPVPTPEDVEYDPCAKSLTEAYLLWLVVGLLGGHHFYLRRPWYGVAYFFTLGLGGVGWLFDMFRMPWLVRDSNFKRRNPEIAHHKSMMDAYVLWFPLGLLGFHLFYLRKPGQGVLYMLTLGVFGIGWLVDLFRIPALVKHCNEMPVDFEPEKSTFNSYMFWLPPVGVLGGHHFYLGRYTWGAVYFITLGLWGFGWLVDTFRLYVLTKRCNEIKSGLRDPRLRYVDDAYVFWFPFGVAGLHHFYLRRYGWGALYFFTFGLAGIGWLVDMVRIPALVKEHNDKVARTPLLLADPAAAVSSPRHEEERQGAGAGGTADGSDGPRMVYPSAPVMPPPVLPAAGVYDPAQLPPAYQSHQPPGASAGAAYPGEQQEYPPPSYEESISADKN